MKIHADRTVLLALASVLISSVTRLFANQERADVEWKFARSKLWISYFEEGGTVPPPFNIIPTPKSVWYIGQWIYRKLCGHSRAAKKEHMRTIRVKRQFSDFPGNSGTAANLRNNSLTARAVPPSFEPVDFYLSRSAKQKLQNKMSNCRRFHERAEKRLKNAFYRETLVMNFSAVAAPHFGF